MRNARRAALFVLLSAAAANPAAGQAAGQASGAFKAGDKVIAPKYAAAYQTRDQRDARKTTIEVVLSEAPIDAKAAVEALDPHTHVINQDALDDTNYILLWVADDGSVTMNATFSETMTQYIAMRSDLKAELTEKGPGRVAGRVFTAAPIETMDGEKYQVDVRFSTEVALPPPGTALPADGGEPGRALVALSGALGRNDGAGIRAGISARQLSSLEADYRSPEENLASILDLLRVWLPKAGLRPIGGRLHGEIAVLEVEGELFEGQKALYLVRMVKEGGAWKFDQGTNAGLL
jgi:hypothetical protein